MSIHWLRFNSNCYFQFQFSVKSDIRLNTDFQANISLSKTMFTLSNIKKIKNKSHAQVEFIFVE
jgi:hypothetical protein